MSAHDTRLAGASHGSFRSYGIGFALSVLLTVIPFALVMFPVLAHGTTLTLVVIMAVAQVLAYVYQMQSWQQGKGTAPNKLSDELPIPDEYRY